jgi:hypothetical protein
MNKSRKIVSCIFLLFVILVSLLFSHFTSVKITEGLVGDYCTATTDCDTDTEICNDDTNKCVSSSPEASKKNPSNTDASDDSTKKTSSTDTSDDSKTNTSSTDASDDEIETLKKDKNKLKRDLDSVKGKLDNVKDLVCDASVEGFTTIGNKYTNNSKPSSDGIFNHLFDDKKTSTFSLVKI